MYLVIIFYLLLFLVAFLYSSVGHGGASGYLALMASFSLAPDTMRSTALLLNVFISLMAFIQYYRSGHFQWKLFWPFALLSIPAAFFGGMITVDQGVYKKILALLLLFSVVKLIGFKYQDAAPKKEQSLLVSLFIGFVIGLLSGMIGIGGGILLSPLILLLHWANMKQTAAVSALFIFVNSLAGLAGLFFNGLRLNPEMGFMIAIALSGGALGAFLGASKFNSTKLKYILACVLIIASIRLMFT